MRSIITNERFWLRIRAARSVGLIGILAYKIDLSGIVAEARLVHWSIFVVVIG